MGSRIPGDLFPHPSMAWACGHGRGHRAVYNDALDRTRQPSSRLRGGARRGEAIRHGGGPAARRRNHCRDGNGGSGGPALGRGQQSLHCRRRSPERHCRFLWQLLEGSAAPAAVGHPRARRLSGDPAGADRRRHGRRLDHDGACACYHRDCDRQLAQFRRRPAKHRSAVGCAHARPRGAPIRRCRVPRKVSPSSRSWSSRREERRRSSPARISASRPDKRSASSARAARARPRWCALSWASGGLPRAACATGRRRARPMGSGASRRACRLPLANG